jgi:hypothetical protein
MIVPITKKVCKNITTYRHELVSKRIFESALKKQDPVTESVEIIEAH